MVLGCLLHILHGMTVQKGFVLCLFIYVFQALIPYHHLLIFGGHYDVSLSVDENTGIISLEIVMQEQVPNCSAV